MILVHGSDPLTDGGAGLGHSGNGTRSEVLIINVWLDLRDNGIWNVVTIVLEQAVQELLWVLKKCFPHLPVVVNLHAWLVTGNFLGLDLFHDAHCLDD